MKTNLEVLSKTGMGNLGSAQLHDLIITKMNVWRPIKMHQTIQTPLEKNAPSVKGAE